MREAVATRRVLRQLAPNQLREITSMKNGIASSPLILRRPQVEQRTGLSRSTLYQYIQDGHFPRPRALGPRAVGWLESDVDAWIAARETTVRPGSMSIR
jgi:prophage regulatory protein